MPQRIVVCIPPAALIRSTAELGQTFAPGTRDLVQIEQAPEVGSCDCYPAVLDAGNFR